MPEARRLLHLREEPYAEREADQLRAVRQPEFLHDPRSIGVHRLRRNEQLLADLTRTEPLGRERENLLLSGTEAV